MKLIKLSANKPSFKTINFRPSGLSLIVGRSKGSGSDSSLKTYNGIGKSLSIYLLHFCLGSSKDDKLSVALPGWEFTLEFEHAGQSYTATRGVDDQQTVVLNRTPLHVDDYTSELGKLAFRLEKDEPFLSFRSLIVRFIRPTKFSYLRWDGFIKEEKAWESLLRNGMLFGIDPDIIRAKYEIRKDQIETDSLAKQIKNDTELAKYFSAGNDARIERRDLEDQIAKLEHHLAGFEIAEDYGEVKRQVMVSKRRLEEIALEVSGIDERISVIDANLQLGADLPRSQLLKILEEAKVILASATQRTLEELETFHQRLLTDRRKRLESERAVLDFRRGELKEEQAELSAARASQLSYLSHCGALSDYMTISHKLSDLRSRLDRLKTWQDLITHYKERVNRLKARLSALNLETDSFLRDFEPKLEHNLTLFRSFSSKFYENKPGGITLSANDGENQLRFGIKASIDDDSSDGIGDVKIFCYDMMVLLARHHHDMETVVHDGRLFGGMDPRQRSILFQQAKEAAEKHGIQYVANINEDHLESIRSRIGDSEFATLFKDAFVLELTDDSDDGKLLGTHVRLEYDS